jgi:SAM-dependent methyltransferase
MNSDAGHEPTGVPATTGRQPGTAARQGRLWGARTDAWARVQQHTSSPSWSAVLADLEPVSGRTLLDVGCGAGGFAHLAARAGATVAGIDAAPPMIDHARRLVPEGTFQVGDIENLPYDDGSFDAVTGFNAFQYAADPVAALRGAARVTKPGGHLVVMIWGTAAECEAAAYLAAIGRLLPPPPPGAPGPFALSEPGVLETLLSRAGLAPTPRRVVSAPWQYPDEETMLAGLMSSGPAVAAIESASEQVVREALRTVCAPYRRSDGSYRMENTFHHVICAV